MSNNESQSAPAPAIDPDGMARALARLDVAAAHWRELLARTEATEAAPLEVAHAFEKAPLRAACLAFDGAEDAVRALIRPHRAVLFRGRLLVEVEDLCEQRRDSLERAMAGIAPTRPRRRGLTTAFDQGHALRGPATEERDRWRDSD